MSSSSNNDTTSLSNLFLARGMESIVGDIVGEYACSWENCSGTLYAGSKGVYFLGSFFLLERKVVLYWDQVRLVQKVDQGIVVVGSGTQKEHFYGIHSPTRVWSLLVSMHNEALLINNNNDNNNKSHRHSHRNNNRTSAGNSLTRSSIRRRNSDPWNQACLVDDLFNQEQDCTSGVAAGTSTRDKQSGHPSNSTDCTAALVYAEQWNHTAAHPTLDSHSTNKKKQREDIQAITGTLRLPPLTCSSCNVAGKLYVGEEALHFSGQRILFFWDLHSCTIPWNQVVRFDVIDTSSEASSSSSEPWNNTKKCNGLRIVRKDEEEVELLALDNADQVWSSLLAIHNEVLTKSADRKRPSAPRRMNSDPLYSSHVRLDVSPSEEDTTVEDSVRTLNSIQSTESQKPEGISGLWSKVKENGNFSHVVVKDHSVPCSLDGFFDTFLRDNASHSLAKFMSSRGDSELRTDAWKALTDGGQSRTVYYTHPVNAPLAPPQAAARKEQTFQRYGNFGCVLETKTFVQDVPMTDCFYVADRTIVESNGKKEVLVKMEFEITFIKSTMFKGIISKTTQSEFVSFIKDFAAYTTKVTMGEDVSIVKDAEPAQRNIQSQPTLEQRSLLDYATPVLLFFIVVFQAWIILELRGIKTTVAILEAAAAGNTNGESTE